LENVHLEKDVVIEKEEIVDGQEEKFHLVVKKFVQLENLINVIQENNVVIKMDQIVNGQED